MFPSLLRINPREQWAGEWKVSQAEIISLRATAGSVASPVPWMMPVSPGAPQTQAAGGWIRARVRWQDQDQTLEATCHPVPGIPNPVMVPSQQITPVRLGELRALSSRKRDEIAIERHILAIAESLLQPGDKVEIAWRRTSEDELEATTLQEANRRLNLRRGISPWIAWSTLLIENLLWITDTKQGLQMTHLEMGGALLISAVALLAASRRGNDLLHRPAAVIAIPLATAALILSIPLSREVILGIDPVTSSPTLVSSLLILARLCSIMWIMIEVRKRLDRNQ